MNYCSTCGMPITKPEEGAGKSLDAQFCVYCVNDRGEVKTSQEIFDGGVQFFMGATGATPELATKLVRRNMRNLPYWQGKNEPCLEGAVATDAEWQEALAQLN